jgi:hypothetical protein
MNGLQNNKAIKKLRRAAAATVVENLETRQLMSVTWSDGNLTVNGTNNADTIVVETKDYGLPGIVLVQVTENGKVTQPFIPYVAGKSVTVNGKGGADNIQCQKSDLPVVVDGGAGTDTIHGGSKADVLKGGDNNDTIYGRDGDDTLFGGNHNDTLIGGWGADDLIGGDGKDTADYSARNANLMLSIDGGANDGEFLEFDDIYTDVENVIGGDGDDLIMGDGDANELMGGEGSDAIYGFGGLDYLYGGTDADVFEPGAVHNDRDLIYGGEGADHMYAPVNGSAEMHGGNHNDTMYGSNGRDALHGDAGNDWIEGGSENDQLWGGDGDDTLKGGKGDDTLVTIGGGLMDKPWGNEGFDTFWLDQQTSPFVEDTYDASVEEVSADHIHRVESFHPLHYNTTGYESLPPNQIAFVDKNLNGQNIVDPMQSNGGTQWKNFSDQPLFADYGTTAFAGDVRQGSNGKTWFSSALSGVARANADRICQTVVDLGDGTYAVNFGAGEIYRVDGDLPVDGSGKPIYLGTGKDGAIWPAIIEKALAFADESKGTYKSIEDGDPEDGYAALRSTGTDSKMSYHFGTATDMLKAIAKMRNDDGKPVSINTWASLSGDTGAALQRHAYDVVKVNKDAGGNCVSIELRNPWGVDGKGDGSNPNDGVVTLTKAQIYNATAYVSWANK